AVSESQDRAAPQGTGLAIAQSSTAVIVAVLPGTGLIEQRGTCAQTIQIPINVLSGSGWSVNVTKPGEASHKFIIIKVKLVAINASRPRQW
ncbi:MAG TPA: hypothetical protein VEL31_19490, partial [Ktedonobacteraceae bacterium]|nr:hypothetical protein [Ktedonobacteraceae bacterium]